MNGEIIGYINKKFGCTLSNGYYSRIAEWKCWWSGYFKPFHRIKFSNGKKQRSKDMYTLKMAKKVCEDWAAILINSKTHIELDNKKSEEFLTGSTENGGVFGSNNFWDEANGLMERMMWSGTAAVVIRLKNAQTNMDGRIVVSSEARIDLNYIDADMIIPLSCDNGIITEAAFCSELSIHGKERIYLEIHYLENGEYIIENHIFRADKGMALAEDELPDSVPPVIRTGSDRPWFAICTPAIVNPIPGNNGMGCSVYYNAIDNLKGTDLAFNNFCSDIYLGQKKVFLNKNLMAQFNVDEEVAPDDVNQQLFCYVAETMDDGTGKSLVQEHNPDLRVEANSAAVQAQLDYLSFKVGFGTKHYQFNNGSVVTATQYIGDKQDLIQNSNKHFIHVESFLYNLVKSILFIGHNYIDPKIDLNTKISVIFDQSPLIDENSERLRDRDDVSAGLMAKWEYRVKWYGETEEQARAAIEDIEGGQQDDDTIMGFGDGG